jgi:hypothetical protein
VSALSVHLNREKPREVDAPASFTGHRQFDIALENHGDSAAVHVQLDDALSAVAQLGTHELRVGPGETKHVRVTVGAADEPVTGELTITLGYGVSTGKTTVTLEPSQPEEHTVTVDESLGSPRQQTKRRRRPKPRTLGLLAFAGVALLVAIAVALTVESTVVLGAAVLVAVIAIVGVVAALY